MVNSLTKRCPAAVAAKQAQINTLQPPVDIWYAVFGFVKHGAVYYSQTFPLWVCPEDIVPEDATFQT